MSMLKVSSASRMLSGLVAAMSHCTAAECQGAAKAFSGALAPYVSSASMQLAVKAQICWDRPWAGRLHPQPGDKTGVQAMMLVLLSDYGKPVRL